MADLFSKKFSFAEKNEPVALDPNAVKIESLTKLSVSLQRENDELWKELHYLEQANETLHARLDDAEHLLESNPYTATTDDTPPILASDQASKLLRLMTLFSLIPSRQAGFLSVNDCLSFIETLAPERVVILPSARKSADDIAKIFEPTTQLLSLLALLVTDYVEVRKKAGDPYTVFTKDNFSSNESDTTQNSQALSKTRTFMYNGKPLPMMSHLRIGVVNDKRRTIRVHFAYDDETERVIIGWCGEHRPI